jgi:gamma-glutamylcyclotransferase (GGCT)/AIG2-like uncharacterized protein YtfP
MDNLETTSWGNSSPQKNEKLTTTVFVYGSLRRDQRLNPVLADHSSDSRYIGQAKTHPLYKMYDLGAFPCITRDGNTSIVGDLYKVSNRKLRDLDMIEGVPNLYTRETIEIDFDTLIPTNCDCKEELEIDTSNINAYFWGESGHIGLQNVIDSGDYVAERLSR